MNRSTGWLFLATFRRLESSEIDVPRVLRSETLLRLRPNIFFKSGPRAGTVEHPCQRSLMADSSARCECSAYPGLCVKDKVAKTFSYRLVTCPPPSFSDRRPALPAGCFPVRSPYAGWKSKLFLLAVLVVRSSVA